MPKLRHAVSGAIYDLEPDGLVRIETTDGKTSWVERYTSRAFHELEVEKVWKRVWQMACREEDVPEVGDPVVYEVANLSILVIRSAPDTVKAYHNVCLHRGRILRERDGNCQQIRCPFHGFTWSLDGELTTIPADWDFPHVDKAKFGLPE